MMTSMFLYNSSLPSPSDCREVPNAKKSALGHTDTGATTFARSILWDSELGIAPGYGALREKHKRRRLRQGPSFTTKLIPKQGPTKQNGPEPGGPNLMHFVCHWTAFTSLTQRKTNRQADSFFLTLSVGIHHHQTRDTPSLRRMNAPLKKNNNKQQ